MVEGANSSQNGNDMETAHNGDDGEVAGVNGSNDGAVVGIPMPPVPGVTACDDETGENDDGLDSSADALGVDDEAYADGTNVFDNGGHLV